MCGGAEALASITLLKTRIERLEETIGKLLLEKENGHGEGAYNGGMCCVTYTDASAELERGVSAAGSNCCVTFHHSGDNRERERKGLLAWLLVAFMICTTIVLVTFASRRGKGEIKSHIE